MEVYIVTFSSVGEDGIVGVYKNKVKAHEIAKEYTNGYVNTLILK